MPHIPLHQVLNLSMGHGLDSLPLLDGDREDPQLPSSPMSSSMSQEVGPPTSPIQ